MKWLIDLFLSLFKKKPKAPATSLEVKKQVLETKLDSVEKQIDEVKKQDKDYKLEELKKILDIE